MPRTAQSFHEAWRGSLRAPRFLRRSLRTGKPAFPHAFSFPGSIRVPQFGCGPHPESCSSEAEPLAKTGGLADVVGSLPHYLRSYGDEPAVVIPRYASIDLKGTRRVYDSLPVFLETTRYDTSIYQAPAEFPLYLVDCPPLFNLNRKGFYRGIGGKVPRQPHSLRGFRARRPGCSAISLPHRRAALPRLANRPGSGLSADRDFATDPTFLGARRRSSPSTTWATRGYLRLRRWRNGERSQRLPPEGTRIPSARSNLHQRRNCLLRWLSTVSRGYAREIQTPEYGFGLDGALRARGGQLSGILNGVDYAEWSPDARPAYSRALQSSTISAGKRTCKARLLSEMGLAARRHGPAADRNRVPL